MITREQVADLREGDVVEYHRSDWPEGVVIRGPLHRALDGRPWIGLGDCAVRFDSGDINGYSTYEETTLTVLSRAPRPLYVNHPRTEPVIGDVVRDPDPEDQSRLTWTYRAKGWHDTRGGEPITGPMFFPARLLVDGETGQVVP